jgi:hypothetical protein
MTTDRPTSEELIARINRFSDDERLIGWLISEAPEIVDAILNKIDAYDAQVVVDLGTPCPRSTTNNDDGGAG